MATKVLTWLDERLGLGSMYAIILDRNVPKVNWWFTLGSASLFLAVMQGVTGIFLTVYYSPSPDSAYDSIQYIMNEVAFGWLIRGIHHWGATLLVIFLVAHMLRTFYFAAYKYPRELTWMTGVVLLLTSLGMGLTGYLLPMNQKSYWATTVATEIPRTVPVIGEFLTRFLRGGSDISAVTLARFYSLHIWLLPAIVLLMIGVHMYLVIRLGISYIPKKDD